MVNTQSLNLLKNNPCFFVQNLPLSKLLNLGLRQIIDITKRSDYCPNTTGNDNNSCLYSLSLEVTGSSFMFVCLCHGISDKKIRKLAIDEGVTDIKGIKKCTALGSQCGKCIKMTKEILAETEFLQVKQAS